MPKKLTVIGALLALVLGVLGIVHSSATATPIQSFCTGNGTGPCPAGASPIDWDVCYGGAAPTTLGTCGIGSSDSAIPVGTGVPINSWTMISVPFGSRLTLPITYTPGDWGYGAPATCTLTANPPVNTCGGANQTGDVGAAVDLFCNSGALDILSSSGVAQGAWPGTWAPFPFFRTWNTVSGPPPAGVEDSYVEQIQPQPLTFAFSSIDKAQLTQLWINGTLPIALPNGGTPLQLLDRVSAYTGGLHTSVALLGGSPNPPDNSYLCLDSPQNSIAGNSNLIPPSVAGYYPRWAVLQSAADVVDGTVTRILDVQCVTVGAPAQADTDGDCLGDVTEAGLGITVGNKDQDGDLVPNGVEVASGSNPLVADADADGATDFDELFTFTNPNVADTDGDGQLDKEDNLAGFNATPPNYGDTTADDNCPAVSNASQDNTDSKPDFTGTPALGFTDATNPHQDSEGDACDTDADNDGIVDVAEMGFALDSVAPGAGNQWCKPKNFGGTYVNTTLDPLNPDFDGDGGLDGRECLFNSNPKDPLVRFPAALAGEDPDGDQLFTPSGGGSQSAETFYRTQGINVPGGLQNNDTDGDTKIGQNDADSDNDGLLDGVEVKFYGTSPVNPDTDGDGCSDGREVGDINGDRRVTSTDLGQIAQRFGNIRIGGVLDPNKKDYDYNKDGTISSTDLGQVAQRFGNCPTQSGLTPERSAK